MKRLSGSEETNYFIAVFSELLREVGSVHSFLEDNESGLHMLETLSARRVLQNLPAYKVASNKKKDDLNVDLDDHSLVMGICDSSQAQDMISVMMLWYSRYGRMSAAAVLLQKLFIDADDNNDGFLTLDEFRNRSQR